MAAKKEFHRKLASLKARRNTVAHNVGAARGQADPLDARAAFEKLDEIEARLESDDASRDLDSLLGDDRVSAEALGQRTAALEADDALAALKKKLGK